MSNEESTERGAVAWMTRNSVASNLFMLILLFAGVIMISRIKQEVLPEFDIDIIVVSVPYPGASPEEVEQGIVLALEEAIQGVEGVKRVTSRSYENVGSVAIELTIDADKGKAVNDVKASIDRISTFPIDAEEPQVTELSLRREVISLVISGDQELSTLHELAEQARSVLREDPDVTQVEVLGVPPRELSIEIPRAVLESQGLTLDDVARQIRAASLDLSSGGIKTAGGELLIRVNDRRRTANEYADIIIRSSYNGAELKLGELASISDAYEDNDQVTYFNGRPAVRLTVYRIGSETPTAVAKAVKKHTDKLRAQLPASVEVSVWKDQSELLKGRINLLLNNAKIGLILVFFILALFLELRLAFWVAMGIPISFLGSFLLLGGSDASINMVSLFAYIVTLGLVVDDAIIVGENIFEEHERGTPWLEAAVKGARQMTVPVTFAILTTIAAFFPLLLVPGVSGKFFKLIPTVVICVLILSLIESFFILPAHLGHLKDKAPGLIRRTVDIPRKFVASHLRSFIDGPFNRVLRWAVKARYLSLSIAMSSLFITIGVVAAGYVPFSFFPSLEGDTVRASARLTYGAPIEATEKVNQALEDAAEKMIQEIGGREGNIRGVLSSVGQGPEGREGVPLGSHLTTVSISLTPSENREISAEKISDIWQRHMVDIPGVENLSFEFNLDGPGAGSPVNVQLSSPDLEILSAASKELAESLRTMPSLTAIDNSFSSGKSQLDYKLLPEGRALGLTSNDIGRQLRAAFFGSEAIREQIGRLERKTMVRLPRAERQSETDVSDLRVRTPQGAYVPLSEVAQLSRSRAPTSIKREDGVRAVNVKAELASGVKSPQEAISTLNRTVFPALTSKYPTLKVSLAGQQRDQGETFSSLGPNYLLALFAIYALLAIPFKSYVQPFIIMSAIPFGFVGAVGGHMLMDTTMSIISMFGIVALTGVVVNDSLVLIDASNQHRAQGHSAYESIVYGAKRRFRPILLTSLTTFMGLAPMILEKSVQAKFLIPMAISIGFGVLFATIIILLIVPCLYMIVEDIIALLSGEKESKSVGVQPAK